MSSEAERDLLERLEHALADALCSADPGAALAALRADPEFGAALGHAEEDGFRIAALLVVRLRFERLLNGSRAAGRAWNEDPRAFTERFKRYHVAVPARASTPAEEAVQFERWSRGSR